MRILALDPATQIGFHSEETSGSFSLGKVKPEKLITLYLFLKETIEREKITHVVYEEPIQGHFHATVSHANLEGIILLVCEMKGMKYMNYTPSAIKKFITGKGNASKEEVIEAVKKLGYEPVDDNEADAIALYLLAKLELK